MPKWLRPRLEPLISGSVRTGSQGLTTDDAPVYGSALAASELDRQQCAVHRQRTVGWSIRDFDPNTLTHPDWAWLPVLRRLVRASPVEASPILLDLWQAVVPGRARLYPEVHKLLQYIVAHWHELGHS